MAPNPIHGLYVIIDPEQTRGRDAVAVARAALEGGATVVQWRHKSRDKGDQLADARAIAAACRERGATFIVNDHVDLALIAGADGVHLGQHDLPCAGVRRLVPAGFLVGVSTNDADEARAAQAAGASYVAVGSVFPTRSKGVTRPAGPERLGEVKAAVDLPVVAIGGIDESNVDQVLEAGADAVAVISAVAGADDVRAAAERLSSRIAAYRAARAGSS